jgi:hypothetical protein
MRRAGSSWIAAFLRASGALVAVSQADFERLALSYPGLLTLALAICSRPASLKQ